jgi:hypothetical protein
MMSTRVFVSLAFVSMLALGGGAMLAQTTRPGDTLQLWEYHTEVTRERGVPPEVRSEPRGRGTGTDAMLNGWGQEGWELVAVTRREVRVEDTLQTETLYAFKRPSRSVNR